MTATSVTNPMLAAIITSSMGSSRGKWDACAATGRLPFCGKRPWPGFVPLERTTQPWNVPPGPALCPQAKPRASRCRDPSRSPINRSRPVSRPKKPRTALRKIRRVLPAKSPFRNRRGNQSTIRRPARSCRDGPATRADNRPPCEVGSGPRRRGAAGHTSSCQPRALRLLSAVCFHCARLSAMIFVDFVAA